MTMIWILIIASMYIPSIYLSRKLFLLCYHYGKNLIADCAENSEIDRDKYKAIKHYGLDTSYRYCKYMYHCKYYFSPSVYNMLACLVPIINTITVIFMTYVAMQKANLGKNTAKTFFCINK